RKIMKEWLKKKQKCQTPLKENGIRHSRHKDDNFNKSYRLLIHTLVIGVIVAFSLILWKSDFDSETGVFVDQDASDDDLTSVIVELAEAPILSSYSKSDIDTLSKQDVNSINELTKKRIQNHEQVIDSLNEKGIEAIKKKDYTLVYHGMEVELPSNKIDTLRKMEDIKAVHKNKIVHANLDTSVPLIRAPETWEEEDEDGLQVTGKGVTVGVVDTGI